MEEYDELKKEIETEKKMRIVILTTKTTHHAFFVYEIKKSTLTQMFF